MADSNLVDKPSSTCVLPSAFTASSNAIACDAIAAKLTEVTKIAESLDSILRELQETLDEARADNEPSPLCRPLVNNVGTAAVNNNSNNNNNDVSIAQISMQSI